MPDSTAGRDDRDPEEGDFQPKLLNSATTRRSEEDGRQQAARTITPRGHRFTSLGEAHQAITSGLTSRSSSQPTTSSGNQVDDDEHTSDDFSADTDDVNSPELADQMLDIRHLEHGSRRSSGYAAEGRCLTAKTHPSKPFDINDFAISPEKPTRTGVHYEEVCPPKIDRVLSTEDGGRCQLSSGIGDNDERFLTSSSKNADENICNGRFPTLQDIASPQLLQPSSSSSGFNVRIVRGESSSDDAEVGAEQLSSTPVLGNRDGAVTKLGFRSDDLSESPDTIQSFASESQRRFDRRHFHFHFPPSGAPEIPLPELPPTSDDALPLAIAGSRDGKDGHLTVTQQSLTTVTDSQNLLHGPTESSQSIYSELGPFRLTDGCSGRYNIAPLRIRSLREQAKHESLPNTSAGLYREDFSSGALSTDSDVDPFVYDRYSWKARNIFPEPSRERDISTALRRVSGVSTIYCPSEDAYDQNHAVPPVPKLPRALAEQQANRSHQGYDPFEDPTEDVDVSHEIGDETILPASNNLGRNLGLGLTRGHFKSDGDDWETVATSHGGFDSNRAVVSGSTDNQLPNFAGSSIADYSDDSISIPVMTFSELGSTDRILQHPSPNMLSDQGSFNLRTMKDTGRPVFLPRPRQHRINGYLQDSCRVFTDPTSNGSAGNSRRASRLDHLIDAFKTRAGGSAYQNIEKRSSRLNPPELDMFDRAEKTPRHSGQPGAKVERFSNANGRVIGTPDLDPGASSPTSEGKSFAYAQADGSFGPHSPNQFEFPLVGLEVFARQQATRRASGEDDQTFVGSSRGYQASSAASSPRTESTPKTSPQTPVAKPRQAFLYRHRAFNVPDKDWNQGDSYELHPFPSRGGIPRTRKPPGLELLRRHNYPRAYHSRSSLSSATNDSFVGIPSYPTPLSAGGGLPCLSYHGENESLAGYGYGALNEEQSRQRQRCWFYFMCAMCTVPFIAPLVFAGKFDGALSWITRGGACSLSRWQKQRLKLVGGLASAAWLGALVVLVVVLGSRAGYYHS